jgi:hypothetical protein
MEITLGMFFKPEEQALMQPIFWISCMGAPLPQASSPMVSSTARVLPFSLGNSS